MWKYYLPWNEEHICKQDCIFLSIVPLEKKSTISLIQQRQFEGTCARRDRAAFFFQTHPGVVDQSKSIGGRWKWDSSEITAQSRTHLTPLIEILVQKALKRRPASVCSGYHVQRARRYHSARSAFVEKKEQPFSAATAFIQSATRFLPSFLLGELESGNGWRRIRRATGKTLGEMYQLLFHDKRLESQTLFMRDVRAIYGGFQSGSTFFSPCHAK